MNKEILADILAHRVLLVVKVNVALMDLLVLEDSLEAKVLKEQQVIVEIQDLVEAAALLEVKVFKVILALQVVAV